MIAQRPLLIVSLLLLLSACKQKEIITIHIGSEKIQIESQEIKRADFEMELKKVVDMRIRPGSGKSNIVIHIHADKDIPTVQMSEFEKAIRRTGISRDYFWTH